MMLYAIGDWVVNIQPTRAFSSTFALPLAPTTRASRFLWLMAASKHWAADETIFAYVEEDKSLTAAAGDLVRVVFK
ncbi:Uncharacterised protein [Klebsiella grimontii]|nr:Uncharacterised protein [Klebsiella grimontii]